MPFDRLKQVAGAVGRFLGPVPGAVRNHLNVPEITRIVVTTLASGGSAAAVAAALAASAGTVVAPADAALAAAVLTLCVDVARRLGHGATIDGDSFEVTSLKGGMQITLPAGWEMETPPGRRAGDDTPPAPPPTPPTPPVLP